MSVATRPRAGYGTAAQRWAGIGPYYAMFPLRFADEVIETFTVAGDRVLDPFAGRASSLFSASVRGRESVGMEINPVGWIYGRVKLAPAPKDAVEARVLELVKAADALEENPADRLPPFFVHCFSDAVLRFLSAARSSLDWKCNNVDRTTMVFILVYLHGKRKDSLSNQMRQSKAMSPDYSMRWWGERGLNPPDVDPRGFLLQRVRWRYAKGTPQACRSQILLGDACELIDDVARGVSGGEERPFKLLFTSPPYYGLTNYHYDQWLRLWMLGGPPVPRRSGGAHQNRFESKCAYEVLLKRVFGKAAGAMDPEGRVYVRTDAREYTLSTTLRALEEAFVGWSIETTQRPFSSDTQTALFGDKSRKPGEVDIVLRAR